MRLLLYNIRYGAGTGFSFHFPLPFYGYFRDTTNNTGRIADFIRSMELDIVGLVEVDGGTFRLGRQHQAAAIAGEAEYHLLYETKYAKGSLAHYMPVLSKQGNAILTRQRIIGYRFHYLNNGMKRLVIEAEFPDFTVFLVHLSLKFRQRHHQLKDLYEMVRQVEKPCIVAGDFNCLWGHRELDLFRAATGLQSANDRNHPSHPSFSPKRELDFILHSPQIRVTDFFTHPITYSDHVPLICDFEVAQAA